MKTMGDPRYLYLRDSFSNKPEAEAWDAMGVALGLDRPILIQYATWVLGAAKGDYGYSSFYAYPASKAAARLVPSTFKLLIGALIASVAFTVLTMSIFISRRRPNFVYLGTALEKIGPAVPIFLLGIFVLLVFSEWTGWTSAIEQPGWDYRLVLASLTLGIFVAYGMIRLLIGAVVQTRNERYPVTSAQTCQAKTTSFWARAGKVALFRLLSVSPAWLLSLLTAIIITEFVFGLPGLGRVVVDAVYFSDIWLAFAAITWLTAAYATVLFASEAVRAFVDPEIWLASDSKAPSLGESGHQEQDLATSPLPHCS